jgi:predicted N-acetyltransferase YhbS
MHKEPALPITWSESIDAVDWAELEALYRAAPLGNKSAAGLQTVFTNSRYCCFAREQGRIVGAGRALADGADCSYLCDVAVLPTHQGTGLGKEIVARLVAMSHGHKKIILYAVPGKEPFYRKFGFRRMLTAMAIFENQAQALERGYVSES